MRTRVARPNPRKNPGENPRLFRVLAVWFALLVVAIVNGALREAAIVPLIGPAAGHLVSTLLLSTAIVVVTWVALPWIAPRRGVEALLAGGLWVSLTLAFEFLAGRYLFGHSWAELLADYNVAAGRIWPLVPITTGLAPWVLFRLSGPR